ncbi:MAG: glycosyltransferase [Burkholderiaceae bacterium]
MTRTRRLLLATRDHYSEHGWHSTLNKAARWLRRVRHDRGDALERGDIDHAASYRWPTPPRVVPAHRSPRTAYLGAPHHDLLRGITCFASSSELLHALKGDRIDVLIVADVPWTPEIAAIFREAFALGVPTAYVGEARSLERVIFAPPAELSSSSWVDPNELIGARRSTMVACDVVLETDQTMADAARSDRKPVLEWTSAGGALGRALSDWYVRMRQPRVLVASVSTGTGTMPPKPWSYPPQSYRGEIEVAATIADATDGILIVPRPDLKPSRDFVQTHVDAHAFGDCEVVVRSSNDEAFEQEVVSCLLKCVSARTAKPDELSRTADGIGGDFSIRRSKLPADTPSPDHSEHQPELRIKFVAEADDNYATLLPLARSNPRPGHARLRVLTYHWHTSHQYELWKLPIDVTLVTGTGSRVADQWDYSRRPFPLNASFRRIDDVDPRQYDLAILHFDENVLAPENTNGALSSEWGATFKLFCERIDLPKVAVCHGTPQFRGQYDVNYSGADLLQPIESERQRLVDYLGDTHVVCNSYQAQSEWRFRQSSVIWHGFDPRSFNPAVYEKGIVSPLNPIVPSRPHYRGYLLYREVFDGHYEQLRPETLRVPEPHPSYVSNAYALAKFRRYVDELRRYSIYFNPTIRSPMPRARGEPMMCGVVTVSARNHDVDRFIENGVDGFYADSADELRSQLYFLMRNPDATRRIGTAARAKAIEVFHIDRYLSDWSQLLARFS